MKLFPLVRQLLELGAVLVGALLLLRFVTGIFTRRSNAYHLTWVRQLQLLFWPLLTLAVGGPLVWAGLLAAPLSGYDILLVSLLAAVILGFAGPALVLHGQYYLRNQATSLIFEPKKNRLEVYENHLLIPFTRQQVVRVEWVECRSRRFFWSQYNYLRLHLADGHVLTLTSLLTNLRPVAEFLRNTQLEQHRRWWCLL
ncbi:hypothetical protein FY528_04070 [Hymenobacter lutimineralis]|uniref:PH domain-containing protein n=1 Tax=Hymenobacter lutimineralis TaxID=2606448 RepID=A0A5D6VBC0_9BACT|nr:MULTISPECIES: hypothetical protein [Hymenobacter]QIX62008.1 hypothetical protein HER32_12760 [Hymenobacter sp. BT18]TYZ12482.1 hypothetical protein FY528_04070 [Hymenobacter lutimineralis]